MNLVEADSFFERLPDFPLPDAIIATIKEKKQAILERFTQDETQRPQVVLVLERSAVLPSASTTTEISQKFPNTQVVNIPVGKVLPYMFAEYKNHDDDTFDETDINLADAQQAQEFVAWLQNTTDPTILALLKQVRNLELSGKNILVLDDARASGETIDFTLKLLLEATYQEPIVFDSECYFSAGVSWEKSSIEQSGIDATPAQKKLLVTLLKGSFDIRRFKIELESDFYTIPEPERGAITQVINDAYAQGRAILPISSELLVKMAGYQALMNSRATGQTQDMHNPATKLLQTYGLRALLDIQKKMKQTFQEI